MTYRHFLGASALFTIPGGLRALAMMALSWLWLLFLVKQPLPLLAASLCMAAAAAFILSRPSASREP